MRDHTALVLNRTQRVLRNHPLRFRSERKGKIGNCSVNGIGYLPAMLIVRIKH